MTFITELARRQAMVSTLRLWLVFLTFAGVAALLIATLQRLDAALSPPPVPRPPTMASAKPDPHAIPHEVFVPTFADAAESLRIGRYAEAYGRFVRLADEGDVDAARIALVMHRFGPEVFGSAWDASVEQLAEWMQWNKAASEKELAQLRSAARGAVVRTGGSSETPPSETVTCTRCDRVR
jgi:hypothetical protein